jgi:hypothetical protein
MGIFFYKGAMGILAVLLFILSLFALSFRATQGTLFGARNRYRYLFSAYVLTFTLSFIYYFTGGSMLYDYSFILYTALFGKLLRRQQQFAGFQNRRDSDRRRIGDDI